MKKKTPQEILAAVQAEAAKVETWADLSNFVFDPEEGVATGVFATEAERREFMETPEFKEIRRLINEAKERTGLVEGATPKKNSKFAVLLPSSLRPALEAEAEREGVSLNQLVVAKLSLQMAQMLAPHGSK
jgi:predicted HicB family RNase H-like nuclease